MTRAPSAALEPSDLGMKMAYAIATYISGGTRTWTHVGIAAIIDRALSADRPATQGSELEGAINLAIKELDGIVMQRIASDDEILMGHVDTALAILREAVHGPTTAEEKASIDKAWEKFSAKTKDQ